MDFPVTKNSLTRAAEAHPNYERCQTPFAAVRINICLPNTGKKQIDEIVEDNFRNENDLIFKEDKDYLIFMQTTPIEAAERAVSRLKAKLGRMTGSRGNSTDNSHIHASAYIFGSSGGSNRIAVRYLDLSPDINTCERKNHAMKLGYGEYVKWFESLKPGSPKISKMVNVLA
jgi:hypothetical protein